MTKDEALKLALEALHGFIPYLPLNDEVQCGRYDKAITAIKEALAQPEQKPVAWMTEDECEVYTSKQVDGCFQHDHIPLYTTPPQRTWVGLTDEEVGLIADDYSTLQDAIGEIEAKLRSKNS